MLLFTSKSTVLRSTVQHGQYCTLLPIRLQIFCRLAIWFVKFGENWCNTFSQNKLDQYVKWVRFEPSNILFKKQVIKRLRIVLAFNSSKCRNSRGWYKPLGLINFFPLAWGICKVTIKFILIFCSDSIWAFDFKVNLVYRRDFWNAILTKVSKSVGILVVFVTWFSQHLG